MLEGWRQQQLSRSLAFSTVDARLELLRRFQTHSGDYPWRWMPQHLEEWSTDLRAVRGLARSTVRAYQLAVRAFLAYACDPLYGWDLECGRRFGTPPGQNCHEANSAAHVLDVEGRPQRRAPARSATRTPSPCSGRAATRCWPRTSRRRSRETARPLALRRRSARPPSATRLCSWSAAAGRTRNSAPSTVRMSGPRSPTRR